MGQLVHKDRYVTGDIFLHTLYVAILLHTIILQHGRLQETLAKLKLSEEIHKKEDLEEEKKAKEKKEAIRAKKAAARKRDALVSQNMLVSSHYPSHSLFFATAQ
jgi:hypothetical protein